MNLGWSKKNNSNNKKLCYVRLTKSVDQTLKSTIWTPIQWDNIVEDSSEMFDSANKTRIAFPTDGRYKIIVTGRYYQNTSGDRYISILKNSTTNLAIENKSAAVSSTNSTFLNLVYEDLFFANEYIEIQGLQSSGGDLKFEATNATLKPSIYVVKVFDK